MNDDDRKKRERRSLNPNLPRYIDNTSTTLLEWERKNTKKQIKIFPHNLTLLALYKGLFYQISSSPCFILQALFRNFLSPIFNYDTTTVFLSYLSRTSSKVATFELTLVDQAWVWFRTLNKDIVTDFLTNFAPRGSKWNQIDQLFSLKQEASEMVKDYIRRMKTRCRMQHGSEDVG